MPSRQTLFRWHLDSLWRGEQPADVVSSVPRGFRSLVSLRLRSVTKRIEAARDPAGVILLATQAVGPAEHLWHRRMRGFGSTAIPFIRRALSFSGKLAGSNRDILVERLIGSLSWHGEAGAVALMEELGALDDFGRSLACIVLGRLHHGPAADSLWRFYEATKEAENAVQRPFVGALWGLIDLPDARVGTALAELVSEGRRFYELYGLVALAGNQEAIVPLLGAVRRASGDDGRDPLMALAAVAGRVGRTAFLGALAEEFGDGEEEQATELADLLLSRLGNQVHPYFEAFYD